MPAKQEAKSVQYNEQVATSSSQDSPTSIIRKLYGAVLDNKAVKIGMERVQNISQPILDKYHEVLVEGRLQVDEFKKMGEGVYTSTTERVKTWCYSITIYNHFVGLWLIKNLPFNSDQVVSYEEYLESFQDLSKDTSEESRKAVENFYREASKYWVQLKNPDLEDIKSCCLLIAAKAIAADYQITVDGYSSALVDVFYSLSQKQNDIITEEAFYLLTLRRVKAEEEDQKNLRRATKEFYTFAKRFAHLEFPLTYANHDLLRILIKFGREKFDVVAEAFLSRVDRVLDLTIKNFGIECEIKEKPINVFERLSMIAYKAKCIGSHTARNSRLAIEDSKAYKFVDNRVHFHNRYNDLSLVFEYVSQVVQLRVAPTFNAITYSYDKLTNEYLITMKDVSSELIREKASQIRERYSVLKDATFNLKDKVLEIRVDKETLTKYNKVAKEQIAVLYEEVRNMDSNKIRSYGGMAYQRALDAIKRKGTKAIEKKEEAKPKSESQETKKSQ